MPNEYQPRTYDCPKAKAVLDKIRCLTIKGADARRALTEARYEDWKDWKDRQAKTP